VEPYRDSRALTQAEIQRILSDPKKYLQRQHNEIPDYIKRMTISTSNQ